MIYQITSGSYQIKGCSHILTQEECEHLKWAMPGECVQFLLEPPSGCSLKWLARVLDLRRVNCYVPPLYLSKEVIERKVLFDMTDSLQSSAYEYDWVVSAVSAYIAEYSTEIFNGSSYTPKVLEKLAIALLDLTKGFDQAKEALLFDVLPDGCNSLSQFFLTIVYP